MSSVLAFAVILGIVLGHLLREQEVRWLRTELGIAHDQLFRAQQAGAVIPARPAEEEVRFPGEQPLPGFLQKYVDRFESDAAKESARAKIRAMRSRGTNDDAIWMELQRQHPDLELV